MSRQLSYLLIALLMPLTGCATITSGTTQKVNVTTTPSGAMAKVDGTTASVTPAVFTLERKNNHTIEISKEGYRTVQVFLHRTLNGMTTGNVLIGGIIGTGVDAMTGSMYKLVPENVNIILEEGTGFSETPTFASKKDSEFYNKTILKSKTQTEVKGETKSPSDESLPKSEAASTDSGNGQDATASMASVTEPVISETNKAIVKTSNFGPKN